MRWRAGAPSKSPEYIDLPHLDASPKRPLRALTRLFAKRVDGVLYGLEPDGTETAMGGGSIPTDAIWDAKGDLAAGTGANAAARVAAAANGAALITASAETAGLKWRLNNDGAAVAPTVNEDSGDGYAIGSRWLDTTADKEYVCLDATAGAAVWAETTGGAGGAPSTAKYIVSAAHGSLSAEIVIPGLAGSPDVVPSSPSSDDDEFDAALSGWTTLGSLDTSEANVIPSHYHIAKTATGTFEVHGIYKAAPGVPFTVTVALPDYLLDTNYQHYAIMLADSTPTKLFLWGPLHQSANGVPELLAANWNSRTSRGSFTEYTGTRVLAPKYLRLVVNSSTDLDLWWSHNGLVWKRQATAWNPGFTVANVGLALTGNDVSVTAEAAFDWVRFT